MDEHKRIASLLLLALLAGCNFPTGPSNEGLLETAIAGTLAARPLGTPTAAGTATVDPEAEPAGKIVYVCQFSRRVNRNQICIVNADGSGQRVLTPGGAYDDFFPSVAPEGSSVLFASSRTGRYQIYELDLVTQQLKQLTNLTTHSAYAPTASPDGEFIVFYARVDGKEYPASHSIWVMHRDGTGLIQLTQRSGGGWDPVWSPDGTRILFAGEASGAPQLFIMDADGSDLRQVTNLTGIRGRNDWSPDGLTLSTYIGSAWDRDIYIFDPNGENVRQVTDGIGNLAPSFSPDGQWITFMSYRDHPRQDLGCEIYIMRIDGSEPRRLTDNDICDWQPRWGR